MLECREVPAREPFDVDPEGREPFARGDDLSGLERILLAAGDVEGDGASELPNDRREIPSLGVAAMLADEPGSAVHERSAAAAADRVAQIAELGGARLIG